MMKSLLVTPTGIFQIGEIYRYKQIGGTFVPNNQLMVGANKVPKGHVLNLFSSLTEKASVQTKDFVPVSGVR